MVILQSLNSILKRGLFIWNTIGLYIAIYFLCSDTAVNVFFAYIQKQNNTQGKTLSFFYYLWNHTQKNQVQFFLQNKITLTKILKLKSVQLVLMLKMWDLVFSRNIDFDVKVCRGNSSQCVWRADYPCLPYPFCLQTGLQFHSSIKMASLLYAN